MEESISANLVVGTNRNVSGALTPKSSSFNCWSPEFFLIERDSDIYGKSHTGQPISLLNCYSPRQTQHQGGEGLNCSCDLFSHTMILGDEHVFPEKTLFDSISLTVGNPLKLLRDTESFGYVHSPKEALINALNEQEFTPHFDLENRPAIAYFNGDFEIFSQYTKLGHVTASNSISYRMFGSAEGVQLKNKIVITIDFSVPCKLDDAFKSASLLSFFLRFISGQGLYFKDIELKKLGDKHFEYKVHHSHHNWGEEKDFDSYYSDPLVNVVNENFGSILKQWFDREERENVRLCFYNTFFSDTYSSQRLISAANMFDIFPQTTEGLKKQLSPNTQAQIKSLKLRISTDFKSLPEIKNSLFQSIGFLDRKSLKDRILERVNIIRPKLVGHMRAVDFEFVVKYGVKCRNYFVHGSIDKNLSPEQCFQFQSFFIDVFEYIYAVSELIECGWNDNNEMICNHRIRSCEREIEFGAKQLADILQKRTKVLPLKK